MANSVDPDLMLHSVASDLGVHCLFRSVYMYVIFILNIWIPSGIVKEEYLVIILG